MVVDDDPSNVKILHQALAGEYRILMALNGLQAINVCLDEQPDIVLLDVKMPAMNGYEVCARLKSNPRTQDIPVIFVTARDDAQAENLSLASGGVDFIPKPFNAQVLAARVGAHLRLKMQADALKAQAFELDKAQELGRIGSWTWQGNAGALACSAPLLSLLSLSTHDNQATQIAALKDGLAPVDWLALLRRFALASRGLLAGDLDLSYKAKNQSATESMFLRWKFSHQALPGGYVVRGTVLDITQQRLAERLRVQKEAAEEISLQKSKFVSSVSHEMRTPLNALLGFAQLLSQSPAAAQYPSVGAQAQLMLEAGQHLLTIVEDLLNLGCIEAGALKVKLEPVHLPPLLMEAKSMLALDASRKGIQVIVHASPPGAEVVADGAKLRQVLLNLLSNAIKYNRPDGAVHVRTMKVGSSLTIAVEDTGKGLSVAQLEQLFERFNRLGAENSAIPGMGIGLAITRQLVEAIGGRIHVESCPGVGSIFSVTLPLSR